MTADLWPYSGRNDGETTNLEHEALLACFADGVLPGEPSTALDVSVGGGSWTVQPGRMMISGHVLSFNAVEAGATPDPAASTVWYTIAAHIDRTQAPWTYGITVVPGSPGGGAPALNPSPTGLYRVALRSFTVAAGGSVTLQADQRVFLTKTGRPAESAWKTLGLAIGYATYDDTPQYRLTHDGKRVEIRGTIRRTNNGPLGGATPSAVAVLPAEARPSGPIERFTGQATLVGAGTTGACRVEILRDTGVVNVWTQDDPDWVGVNGYFWID